MGKKNKEEENNKQQVEKIRISEKKSRERMEIIGNMGKEKRKKQKNSNIEKNILFVEVLGTLPIIIKIREKLKRVEEQRMGNQNISSQIINLKY